MQEMDAIRRLLESRDDVRLAYVSDGPPARMAPVTVERLETDQQLRWAVERGLQVAADALFDAGAHVLAAEYHEAVDEYRQIPKRLLAHGVLSATSAERLRGLAGFRNVLVHEYADIDPHRCEWPDTLVGPDPNCRPDHAPWR